MEPDIKVTNNFINQKDFIKLQEHMLGSFFPWYYNPMVVFDQDSKDYFQFTHLFYNGDADMASTHSGLLKPILDKIEPFTICRVKANLLTKTNKIIEHGFHTDFTNDDRITTGVFYINSNNGYTKFENGQVHKSEANKFVEFNSTEMHTGSTCTDENIRIVINLNYIKGENK
tara:strand:- start:700 stop:1215 length:516 start_codon:yes stop_codon:yes gene_type:complete